MKRLDIIVATLVIGLAIGFIWLWQVPRWQKQEIVKPYSTMSVNKNARIAANGNPLPSTSNEDIIISVRSGIEQPEIFKYDFDSKGWQLENLQNLVWEKIRWIDGQYFVYNNEDKIWDEIDKNLIKEDFPLAEIEKDPQFYFLPTDQLDDINDNLEASLDENCQSGRICAVWILNNEEAKSVAVIRVDKLSRKIIDFTIIDNKESLIVEYDYQEVEIEFPKPVRLLNN